MHKVNAGGECMFITVKRSSILMVILILCVSFGIFELYRTEEKQVFQTSAQCSAVIDAGHGGMDGGAVGTTGVLEKNLNLEVAKKLQKLVTDGGGTAFMTREEDLSLHTDSDTTVREQKRSDLTFRRSFSSNSGADAFISIHMNKFEQSQYRGAQIFYSKDSDSKRLAELITTAAAHGLEAKRLGLVRHWTDAPVSMILLQLRKGGKPGLVLEEYCLFDAAGGPTSFYKEVYHME